MFKAKSKEELFLFYLFLFSMFLAFLGSLFYFVYFKQTTFVLFTYGFIKFLMFITPIILVKFHFKLPKFSFKIKISELIESILLGIGLSLLIYCIFFLFHDTFVSLGDYIAMKINAFGVESIYWYYAICFSFIHSLFEEYFWRFYAYGGFRRFLSKVGSAFFSSALFSLHHFVVISQFTTWYFTFFGGIFVFLAGFIWCMQYEKSQSLTASWISHMCVDLMLFYMGYLLVF